MAYVYRDRLKHNSRRFEEINNELITYETLGGDTVEDLAATTVLRRPYLNTRATIETTIERQFFAVQIEDLDAGSGTFLPIEGDQITRANGDIYEVVLEDPNKPPYEYVTADRERILIYAQLYEKAAI